MAGAVAGAEIAIEHKVFIAGSETGILSNRGELTWKYPAATRDGFVLPNGNVLLALAKSKDHPHGAVIEVTRTNDVVFLFEGTQSEVNTAQALPNGNVMLTEGGDHPRVLEVDRAGKIVLEVPMQGQTANHHMESRMARKLANGNYLVPQQLDKVVREYSPTGKIVWEFQSPEAPRDCLPFTAIRLADGHTLVTLTSGNLVVEVDSEGRIAWQLSNDDLPEPLLKVPCGAQRLPNGNTVIASYRAGEQRVKLLEVTRAKKIVWTLEREQNGGIHEFQVLDTNGMPVAGTPLK
jgi:outer membrane protein assembly factor BamB